MSWKQAFQVCLKWTKSTQELHWQLRVSLEGWCNSAWNLYLCFFVAKNDTHNKKGGKLITKVLQPVLQQIKNFSQFFFIRERSLFWKYSLRFRIAFSYQIEEIQYSGYVDDSHSTRNKYNINTD